MTRWECRTAGDVALNLAQHGEVLQGFDLESCRKMALPSWNGEGQAIGSQNFRPPVEAIARSAAFFASLAEVYLGEGLWARELGSETYTPSQVPAWINGLSRVGQEQPDAVDRVRRVLRATWTLLALVAWPEPKRTVVLQAHDGEQQLAGDAKYFSGPTVALAGERDHPSTAGQSLLGPMLAWAVDWPGRKFSRYPTVTPQKEGDDVPYTLPLASIGGALGCGYGRGDVAAFGLTGDEAAILQKLIRGDAGAARTALAWLQGVPLWRTYTFTMGRTEQGAWSALAGASNGNKPPFAAVAFTQGGRHEVLQPSIFKKEGASSPRVEIGAQEVKATADGVTRTLAIPGGKEVYRLEWSGSGITGTVGGQPVTIPATWTRTAPVEPPRKPVYWWAK
ncbi:MAG TPA: hypothetical protein VHQ65_08785 [Thermoanaerobaculia bacterium]|nr:hypothetical protein [Thermoanaerobaculia bacterium]